MHSTSRWIHELYHSSFLLSSPQSQGREKARGPFCHILRMAATLSFLQLLPPHKPKLIPQKPSVQASNQLTKFSKDISRVHHQVCQSLDLLKPISLPAAAIALPFFLNSEDALAAGGEFGILEGRSFALVHPIVMGGLFLYTLWAGYLGWQWRRVRTIQNEINDLKKQVKPVASEGEAAAEPPKLTPVELKIQQLTEERKELLKGSFRDRHFNAGSILLGFGVLVAVGGCLNTWFRTDKLFPGPHLFAGAAITVLWAAAAALVPSMQKGSETARNLHIALNAFNVVLFVWQIPTGIEIVYRVFEFTTWP